MEDTSKTDVLVFGAHPDDAEFAMGATIARMVDEGRSVTLCVLTRGESGSIGTPEIREQEMKEAAKAGGVGLEILDFKDNQVVDTYENRLKLAAVIRKYRPRIIFASYHTNDSDHHDGTAHPDHTGNGQLARHAARYARFRGQYDLEGEEWNADLLIYYLLPVFKCPDFVVDVTDYMEKWEQTARCHKSQVSLRKGKVIELLKTRKATFGYMTGVPFAEGFIMDTPLPLKTDMLF